MDEAISIDEDELDPSAESSAVNTFKNLLASRQQQAQKIVDKVARVAFSVVNASTLLPENQDSQVRYVLDMPKSIEEGLRKGTLKLDENKSGELFAQLRGG